MRSSRDFTLKRYQEYLQALKSSGLPFLTFGEILSADKQPLKFVLLRHDVDRRPENALKMARLEESMGLRATYFFRTKRCSFIPRIIQEIHSMGHEIGYHYECLSDTNGDMEAAHRNFESNLAKLRKLAQVQTCSMHGVPLKRFDNRDMWRNVPYKDALKSKYGILGEVYLAIDYSDVAYINDTGRNWSSNKSNLRDQVKSQVSTDFENGEQLLMYLQSAPHPKVCFQIHPERWDDEYGAWLLQLSKDSTINFAKVLFSLLHKFKNGQLPTTN